MVPEYLSNKYTSINSEHEHNVRGTVLWNSLPVEATSASSIAQFKYLVK